MNYVKIFDLLASSATDWEGLSILPQPRADENK